jgi:predicted ATP-dependent serine protease
MSTKAQKPLDFSRFFGGNLVPRPMSGLIIGPRGIGKTTLGLQLAAWDASHDAKATVSSEEVSEGLMREQMRRERIQKVGVFKSFDRNINDILAHANVNGTEFLLIDNLQELVVGDLKHNGSNSSARKHMNAAVARAKETDMSVFFTAHGDEKWPGANNVLRNRFIQDNADTILHLEPDNNDTTLVWASKNRFANLSDSKMRLRMTHRGFVLVE